MIDVYASQPHYVEHMGPVMVALDDAGLLGDVYGVGLASVGGVERTPRRGHGPVLVASGLDAMQCGDRPVIHLNHGVGQTYHGDRDHPVDSHGYVGGPDLDRVALFLCVNEHEAARWAERYPGSRQAVVGTPRLDRWHGVEWPRYEQGSPTVAVSFHWPCTIVREAGSAVRDWRAAVLDYHRSEHAEVLGHWHPRWGDDLALWYDRHGIEPVASFDEVVRRADVYVCDNSSTMYEFAAANDRPVVALNAADWRLGVHHGLRFWSHVPGLMAWPGSTPLFDSVRHSLVDNAHTSEHLRKRAVQHVWGRLLDGRAAARAVDAIAARFA